MMRKILAPIAAVMAASLLSAAAAPAFAAGHGEEAEGSKVTSDDAFMEIDTLTATVARDFRVRGVLQIDAGLAIKDPALRARARAMRPRLRDAYTAALAEYAGGAYQPGHAPDADLIGDMLQAATDRTLGQRGADLLLGMVIVH